MVPSMEETPKPRGLLTVAGPFSTIFMQNFSLSLFFCFTRGC